jgi:threonine synthase
MSDIRCERCGSLYPENRVIHTCESCGGYFDFSGLPEYNPSNLDPAQPGIWKYRGSFSLKAPDLIVTLGEGGTPFLWDDPSTREMGFKLESLNPTGSYKDRGSAVLISQLLSRMVFSAVEDSSGNAGASFAAYCARAGIAARVFVPERAAGPKRRQIEEYGAELIAVPGPRSEAAKAVLQAVEDGETYGSHAYLPFGLPGIATIAYELLEQTGGKIGTIIAPAGHGALLLGIMRGFAALVKTGKIPAAPYYVGVQAENCSPMAASFKAGSGMPVEIFEGNTIAEGVRVAKPVRMGAILKEMTNGKGEIIAIPEGEILPACRELAEKGIYAEPTSALVWAALKHLKPEIPRPIILIISGNGLKYYPI